VRFHIDGIHDGYQTTNSMKINVISIVQCGVCSVTVNESEALLVVTERIE